MPNVHASQTYTAWEIVPEATYGTDPGTGYIRVPFLGETVVPQRKTIEPSKEIRAAGAISSGSYGAASTQGVLRTIGYYNAPFIHRLMCHAFGGCEEFLSNGLVNGTTGITGGNSHAYIPQSYKCTSAGSVGGRPIGLTARAWKAGPNNSAGEIEVISGILINSWEFVHRYNAFPEMAFGMISAKKPVRLSAVGLTPQALGSFIPIKPNGIAVGATGLVAPSFFKAGVALPVVGITEFAVKMETPMAIPDPYANDLDGDYEPAIVNSRRVTGHFNYRMNQASLDAGKPAYEYLTAVLGSQIRLRYASGLMTGSPITPAIGDAGVVPYLFEIAIGAVQWTEGPSSITGPGVIQGSVNFSAYQYTYQSGFMHQTGSRKAPIYVAFSVDEADDLDAKFSSTATGGNDLHTTLR